MKVYYEKDSDLELIKLQYLVMAVKDTPTL